MKKYWKEYWIALAGAFVFLGIIGLTGGRLNEVELLPDAGAAWYYWKLPVREFWPMMILWAMYAAHQFSVWRLIWLTQFGDVKKRQQRRYWLFGVNGFFILLHILQSQIWYDGLAQDVPVMSSQGSVIVMLVLVLIIENDRRGLFFGKKIGGFKQAKILIKKYHGYFIAWALVFTFWYHPTIVTSGHLVGFLYMFLLMIQMSMVYSPVHMNKYWKAILEVTVLFHGTTVAIWQGNGMWPMFMFGFATMLVVTQVYGLDLPKWGRLAVQMVYLVGVIIVFGGFTGHRVISDVHQITWIPIIEYALVFVFLFVGEGVGRLVKNKA